MPYSPNPNSFRRRLRAGEKMIGFWCSLASNLTTEMIGYAGFDWLLIDGEHAPNDYTTFITQLQALKDSDSAPIVRPQWFDPVVIKRLLDIGFYNFLIPFIETEEMAKNAVSATRYPPQGRRGIGTGHRSNKYGFNTDYFKTINDEICVTVQIESTKSIENVDAIAAVEGIDALFIGPSDLSAGMGHFLQPTHPEVQKGIGRILEAGKKHGKAVGILAPVEKEAQMYLDMGMTYVAVGGDIGLFRGAVKGLADRFKKPNT
jgi:2-dehydro-3-deoxyglucarate aldolase